MEQNELEFVRKAGQAMPVSMLETMDASELVSRVPKFTRVDYGGVAAPKGPLMALVREDNRMSAILEKLSAEEQTILGNAMFEVGSKTTASIRKRIDTTLTEIKRRLGVETKPQKVDPKTYLKV